MRICEWNGGFHTYEMENESGTRLTVTDVGASAMALVYRGTDILLGFSDPAAYRTNDAFLGATVGRSANRIGQARFSLNGTEYALSANDGANNLHSGPEGYESRVWETAETTERSVTFRLVSPDGDQGYPGRAEILATYELSDEDEVRLSYRAEADADTIINLTNHSYFNLNGQGSGLILGHRLRLNADRFTPADKGLIPTGEILPVEGTPFDFRLAHAIGRDIDADHPQLLAGGGFDHNYCLNGGGFREAAEAAGDRTGITLRVSTDLPGVQFYAGNSLGGQKGKLGSVYGKREGFCLETQFWPDAVHHDNFPSPVLKAGEVFTSVTVWSLSGT